MPSLARFLRSSLAWFWGRTAVRYLCVGSGLFILGTALVFLGVRTLGWDLRVSEAISRAIGATVGFFAHRHVTFAGASKVPRSSAVGQGSAYLTLTVVNVVVAPWVLYGAWWLLKPQLLLSKVATEAVMVCETYLLLRAIFFTRSSKT